MYRHIAMFKFNDDVGEADVSAIAQALSTLPEAIEQVRDYRHGSDLGLNDGNFDYVVVADFDSVDDYVTYRDHPTHQSLIKEHIAGRVANRAAIQYQFDN